MCLVGIPNLHLAQVEANGGHKSWHDLCPSLLALYICMLSEERVCVYEEHREQREKHREKREQRRIERA
jgi:hypothetical protein